jgi:excisionase family DNA binding protein
MSTFLILDESTQPDKNRVAFTIDEAARRLGLSYGTVYKLVRSGQLPAKKLAKRYLISAKVLEEFLANSDPVTNTDMFLSEIRHTAERRAKREARLATPLDRVQESLAVDQ